MKPLDTLGLLKDYIRIPSVSETVGERLAAEWLLETVGALPYFRERPRQLGLCPCTEAEHGPAVFWALVEGTTRETLLLFHHLDVVGVSDYGVDQALAWDPDALQEVYRSHPLEPDAAADLASGQWLFGRGSCDMKGGGAAQVAYLAETAEGPTPGASVLLLAVPDEEHLSLGMRHAVPLLKDLAQRFGLRYRLAVNSEPNFGMDAGAVPLFAGSVGKATAAVVARGVQCHTGNPFEGLSALAMLSALVAETDGRVDLEHPELPPPAWMSATDLKEAYDVSLPGLARGTVNLLYEDSPVRGLERLKDRCAKALKAMNEVRRLQHWHSERLRPRPLPWRDFEPQVLTWRELMALCEPADAVELERVAQLAEAGASFEELTTERILRALERSGLQGPVVVLALIPPVYPAVRCPSGLATELEALLRGTVEDASGVPLERVPLFMGISDLSYLSLDEKGLQEVLPQQLPLWGPVYSLPLEAMAGLGIPGINLGPRGKDLHQPTERVCIRDVEHMLPEAFRLLTAYVGKEGGTR